MQTKPSQLTETVSRPTGIKMALLLFWEFIKLGAFTFGSGWSIIAQMEQELDFPLFVRSRRSVTLTPAGQLLYDYMKDMPDELEHLFDEARQLSRREESRLCIGILEGQEVSAGDTIARAGMTGRSTGIHLHFEIRENGEPSKLMNSYGKVKLCWVVGGDGGLISEVMDGYGGYYGHKGIDITAERGTPVLAAADGKVYTAEWTVGYGKCVMIDHDGYVTVYGHLDDIYVSDGEKVNRGDAIGTIGSTGYITGTALHFEVRFGDTDEYVCINPLSMLPEHARTSYCIEES